jgi:hypothetical protein
LARNQRARRCHLDEDLANANVGACRRRLDGEPAAAHLGRNAKDVAVDDTDGIIPVDRTGRAFHHAHRIDLVDLKSYSQAG